MSAPKKSDTRKTSGERDKGRKRYGPHPIAGAVGLAAAAALRKRGLAETRIVTHWPEIVGHDMAAFACPEKLTARGKDGGTLLVRVDGAMALELQHLTPLIIEKINGFFGYKAVARLRFQQGPVSVTRRQRRPKLTLSDDQKAGIAALLTHIEDDALRQRLQALGEAISAREISQNKGQ